MYYCEAFSVLRFFVLSDPPEDKPWVVNACNLVWPPLGVDNVPVVGLGPDAATDKAKCSPVTVRDLAR